MDSFVRHIYCPYPSDLSPQLVSAIAFLLLAIQQPCATEETVWKAIRQSSICLVKAPIKASILVVVGRNAWSHRALQIWRRIVHKGPIWSVH